MGFFETEEDNEEETHKFTFPTMTIAFASWAARSGMKRVEMCILRQGRNRLLQ
jgi:hypothetical protein